MLKKRMPKTKTGGGVLKPVPNFQFSGFQTRFRHERAFTPLRRSANAATANIFFGVIATARGAMRFRPARYAYKRAMPRAPIGACQCAQKNPPGMRRAGLRF